MTYLRRDANRISSDEDYHTGDVMNWYSSVVVGTLCLAVGVPGNILSFAVWNRKKMRSSTGVYLMAQSSAHIAVLAFFFLTDSIRAIDARVTTSYAFAVFHCYIGYPMLCFAVTCSIWFTVGVTADRFIMVCLFKHASDICNERKAVYGIIVLTSFCFVMNMPHFGVWTPIEGTNGTQESMELTEFGAGFGGQVYGLWISCLFMVLMPWIAIAVLNVLIIREVLRVGKKVGDQRTEGAKAKQKRTERKLTVGLLTVTITFLILFALQCIIRCLYMVYTVQPELAAFVTVYESHAVGKVGLVISASINFILYCLSGQRFRQELIAIFSNMFGCCHGS